MTPLFSSPHKVSTKDKRRAKAVKLEGEDQPVQSEWVDVEEEPRRSIGTPKQSTRAGPSSSSIHNNRRAYYRKRENSLWQDPANFLPQLGRISENENLESSKSRGKHSSTHGPDPVVTERRSYNISGRQGAPSYPSGSKGRISKLPYNFNASVLSVLSNATNSTQQSSASDSTITQKRYHRAVLEERARKAGQPDLSSVTVQSGLVGMESDPSTIDASTQPNVFDFLYDGKRPASNDGGFVVASETPSDTAASAQPTPPEYWLEASTSRNGSHRAENYRRASSKDEKADVQEIEGQEQRSGYNRVATLQQQGQAFHEHIAFTANPRRKSTVIDAEIEPDSTLLPEDLAHSQRYSYPAPKAIEDRISDQHHEAHTTLPAVPEAPDLSKTTLAGYELMAVKLTEASAAVRPLYRKFEQLEHRVLLHMQDEISELEEHLRVIDECLTQMANIPEDTARRPASRREDLHYGTELHHRRTLLLGQIYLKLEQYHRSLSAYAGVSKGLDPPSEDDIVGYRQWMSTTKPVHEAESRFLRHHDKDLVVFPQRRTPPKTSEQPIAAFLPFILLMPLVAFAVIPGFFGRVFTTTVIAATQWMAVSGTKIRQAFSTREWIITTSLYLLAMAIVATIV